MKFCPNCGTQIPDEAGFCPNCGTAGEAPAAPVAEEAPVINNAPVMNEGPNNGFAAAPQEPQLPPQAPPYQPAQQTPPQTNPYSAAQQPYQQAPQPSSAFQQPVPPQGNPYGAPQPLGNYPPVTAPQEEKASIGLAILSFFIPLVGIILFFVKKKERPKTAKACLIGALISVALSIIFSIIFTIAAGKLVMDAAPELTTSYVDDNGGSETTTASNDSKDKKNNGNCEIGEGLIRAWDDGYSKLIMVAVPVTNNSDQDYYLPSSDMDIEDANGNLVQTISYVSAAPAVVKPGETAYYYQCVTFEGSDVNAEMKLVNHIKPETPDGFWEYIRMGTSEVNTKMDVFDDVAFTGRVENTSDQTVDSVYVYINVFDKDGNLLTQCYDYVDALDPGEKNGFEASSYGWEYTLDDIGSYEVFAYAMV